MTEVRVEHELLRPGFRRVIEKWPDAYVTAEDGNVLVIRNGQSAAHTENVALVVVGKNRLDPHLFERCAAYQMGVFLENGWSIKLLDFGFVPGSSETGQRPRTPGAAVAKVLAETDRLRYIVILTHSRRAINLSDSGNDLVVDQPTDGGPPGFRIAELRLSASAPDDGWVDVFGCMCRPDVKWAMALAKTLNWPVRTVYPGHGIYFPADRNYPRSAIPLTRGFSRERYRANGWAVWFPGAGRPVRVSEPGETAERRRNRYEYLERLVVAVFSVGLEPLRDLRKRLRLSARAKQSPASP
jgi:hypothetical protein